MKTGYKEEGNRLFLVAPGERARSNNGKFGWLVGKTFQLQGWLNTGTDYLGRLKNLRL